ncbi:MAG: NADH-quinone oxidoreductase subunit NuoF [Deltaproteobacteria bacterium]|nr:NADH-quinone oxidoreductase subunit NuoF [Deltaproteobacteria bacterium]MBW2170578.1 NADH-quinone oxidoreductase subunit NuoF [Deltaproteobacteria bacterium]MBW2258955.1 NADH-quinone oxidoreductase subunit NuoF [Deltaproteobacteria bacterium]
MLPRHAARIETPEDLKRLKETILAEKPHAKTLVVCCGTGCLASGSLKVRESLEREIGAQAPDEDIIIRMTGCRGFCESGPLVVVGPDDTFYRGVTADDVPELVSESVIKNNTVERLLYEDSATGQKCSHEVDIPFYQKQERVVLRHCGHIDPTTIEGYIGVGGYEALAVALSKMSPEEVITCVKDSGLRGRGGAGFPTGRKWESSRNAPGEEKYIICNGDEGDPGAFMDRSVMEGDPHSVLEGMIIAGYAVGAGKGIIYVRAEYPLAVRHLYTAIAQASDLGLLGQNIMGTGFGFEIEIVKGAGAFVCGESTALVISIEGKRGFPKPLPRLNTSIVGLWDMPTVLNNVETFACVPPIIQRGAEWFSNIGTEASKGTKVFALVGNVKNTGLVEVPMGTTLREIIFDIGGGIRGGKEFKAVQTGGPSGGCIPADLLDLPVDFESLARVGSIMGSGGMLVMDESTCMVNMARYFLDFAQNESCGQCTLCRLGTRQMFHILADITRGEGRPDDVEVLLELAEAVRAGSICGLGQTVPNPVLSTIKYFREEYEEHIHEKRCRALVCKPLIAYRIKEHRCKACLLCLKACPVDAIIGAKWQVHEIDQTKCIKCGSCMDVCPPRFNAVECLTGLTSEK